MDIIQQIIDAIMGLFGQSPSTPRPVASKSHTAGSITGTELLNSTEHVRVASGPILERRDGAVLIDDDGELLWSSAVEHGMARADYPDCWGPLSGPNDDALAHFMMHEVVFNMAMQADAHEAEQKLVSFGYADAGEFFKVRMTIVKHFGTPTGPTVSEAVLDSQRVMSASMKGASLRLAAERSASLSANPDLIAPIHGCTIEDYAQMSTQAAGKSKEAWAAMLAERGLDLAKWDEVSTGWVDRMREDTTHTLTQLYGAAFQGAGAGTFGAQSAAVAATGYDGTAAAGEAPMSFERCCEIQGATTAWSNTGQDVNALLAKTFDLNAMDWSAANTWWMTQMMADTSMFTRYNEMTAHFEKRYMADAPASPDDDLAF